MKNSEKYVISEGVFDWLLKTLAGKDRAAKIKFYNAVKGDRALHKLSMKKAMQKSHYADPDFDKDLLKKLQRGL